MPWLAPVVGGAAAIGSGLIGAASAAAGRDQALKAYQQSVDDYTAIGVPPLEAQKIVMQQYQSAGQWTPELEHAVSMQDSRLGSIQTDPSLKSAQMQALSKLQEIGGNGGMTLSDRSNLEQVEGNLNADLRGKREAILQDAQQRGGYGSGAALAAQLNAQQGSANQAHSSALATEGAARDRALQAIMAGGQLGGQMQSTEFNQKAEQAKAQDTIDAWNAMNKQSVGNTNVGVGNQASQYNLANKQNLMNSNTDLANKEQVYNKALPQQQFQNQLAIAQSKANARAGQATNLTQNAQAEANKWGNIGSAVAQGVTAYDQKATQQEENEKNRKAYGTNLPKEI